MKKDLRARFIKLYRESGFINLENPAKKRLFNILKVFGITMLITIIFPKTIFITIPAMVIYVNIVSSKKQLKKEKEYVALYKEKVISPLLEENFKNIKYNPDESMPTKQYLEAEYEDRNIENIDKYNSNDHIILPVEIDGKNIGNLEIYDVELKDIKNDGDTTIFEGFTGKFLLSKDIKSKVKLVFRFFINSAEKNNISIDMYEFDKYFDILSEDKVLAMRIFTPDIMEKILKILKIGKHRFELNIINNKLYLRVCCSTAFESTIVINGDMCDILEEDFEALEIMKKLSILIYTIVDNLEI